MNKLLEAVKSIKQDGLVWGGHQFLPIGYGTILSPVEATFWADNRRDPYPRNQETSGKFKFFTRLISFVLTHTVFV
jgi:hypothetical protein